ncbi:MULTISPECIES: hypothetical protein [Bradyrhizobium]|uniref:hypothetical protein n=1 Tax=Bradyrhizobium TaxID=374 RepID=UPI001142BC24|nr:MULTISPECIES: hypothetical protein [Bradyrhizobium]UFW51279.1 hypothetical protein BaraCB756_09830 [Bradyrhizobium arachidis]
MSEHTSDARNFEVITATPERLAVSPGWSYRTWSRESKERIVKEKFFPSARSHGSILPPNSDGLVGSGGGITGVNQLLLPSKLLPGRSSVRPRMENCERAYYREARKLHEGILETDITETVCAATCVELRGSFGDCSDLYALSSRPIVVALTFVSSARSFARKTKLEYRAAAANSATRSR